MGQRGRDLQHHVRRPPDADVDDRLASVDDEDDVGLEDEALAAIENHLRVTQELPELPRRDIRVQSRVDAGHRPDDQAGTMPSSRRKRNRKMDYGLGRVFFFLRVLERIRICSSFKLSSFPTTSSGWPGDLSRLKNCPASDLA